MPMCYAALAAIEVKAIRDGTNPGPNLSEQQMIDCIAEEPYLSLGCDGGYLGE